MSGPLRIEFSRLLCVGAQVCSVCLTDYLACSLVGHHFLSESMPVDVDLFKLLSSRSVSGCSQLVAFLNASSLFSKLMPKTVVWLHVMEAWDKSVVEADMEKWVWKSHKPWVPRPLVSVHVRIGDKGGEMKLVGFSAYMRLAERLRKRFPHVRDVWLSTEMQVRWHLACYACVDKLALHRQA